MTTRLTERDTKSTLQGLLAIEENLLQLQELRGIEQSLAAIGPSGEMSKEYQQYLWLRNQLSPLVVTYTQLASERPELAPTKTGTGNEFKAADVENLKNHILKVKHQIRGLKNRPAEPGPAAAGGASGGESPRAARCRVDFVDFIAFVMTVIFAPVCVPVILGRLGKHNKEKAAGGPAAHIGDLLFCKCAKRDGAETAEVAAGPSG